MICFAHCWECRAEWASAFPMPNGPAAGFAGQDPVGGNAPRSIWARCCRVRWSVWGCQACWACRASWACWWQPGSLFLAEAASAMCPLRRQTSSGASAAGGCRAAPQPALSVVRVPSALVCEQPQPEAAAPRVFGGRGMLGGGRQIPPQPTLRGTPFLTW